jgi:hypothetical protein
MQYYDITISASGNDFQVGATGRFFYYLNGSTGGADQTIKVRAGNSGLSFLLKPGQSITLDDSEKKPDTWYISNYAKQAVILGQILTGEGSFTDNRISGSVEVIDGGKNRTLAGGAFSAASSANPTAANYAFSYLYNPAGSGKNVIVNDMQVSSTTGQTIYVVTGTGVPPGIAYAGTSKKAGSGLASAAVKYEGAQAAYPGTNVLFANAVAAATPQRIQLTDPIVLTLGAWICITATVVNTDLQCSRQFFEESD